MKRGALLALAACASEPDASFAIDARPAPAIVRGEESGSEQDATVLVMHYDALAAGGGAASGCTGSLLTPRLVLTARHCVAITDDGAICDSAGQPIDGGKVTADRDPSAIFVFAGRTRPDFLGGTARPVRGEEILTTGATTLCNEDIALVLLAAPLDGVPIAPVRLDAPPAVGELVSVVGWGVTETEPNPPTRRQRAALPITAIGPGAGLGSTEFTIGEGTCKGDSGGPALAASGAVLGALSRGGNATGGDGADGCVGGHNVFTGVAGHAGFLREGYARAGQEPWLEGEASPLDAKREPPADEGCALAARGARGRSISDSALTACALAVLFGCLRSRKGESGRTPVR